MATVFVVSVFLVWAVAANAFIQIRCGSEKEFSSKLLYKYHERLIKTIGFGGWSISKDLFDNILTLLPLKSTLLELGSGWACGEFSKHYTVYSIEHDPRFLNKYDTNYIYAPIVGGWYDSSILAANLPKEYDLILVDGPLGAIGRYDFLTYIYSGRMFRLLLMM